MNIEEMTDEELRAAAFGLLMMLSKEERAEIIKENCNAQQSASISA